MSFDVLSSAPPLCGGPLCRGGPLLRAVLGPGAAEQEKEAGGAATLEGNGLLSLAGSTEAVGVDLSTLGGVEFGSLSALVCEAGVASLERERPVACCRSVVCGDVPSSSSSLLRNLRLARVTPLGALEDRTLDAMLSGMLPD